jgi:hypothetical protein
MKDTIRPRKEHPVLVGKGLFLIGGILFITGLVLGMSTTNGILFSGAGFVATGSGLIFMEKPGYIPLMIGW